MTFGRQINGALSRVVQIMLDHEPHQGYPVSTSAIPHPSQLSMPPSTEIRKFDCTSASNCKLFRSHPVLLAKGDKTTPFQPASAPPTQQAALSTASKADAAAILSEVNETNLRREVQTLEAFKTRYSSSPQAGQVAAYLHQQLLKLGYQVKYQYFLGIDGRIGANVIATKVGCKKGRPKYLVTAHYDSISTSKANAPGADDNGSGVSAALEIARILSRKPLRHTVEFVFFSGEETGFLGSDFYSWNARRNHEQIAAFINLDMIGFSSNDKTFGVFDNPPSKHISRRLTLLLHEFIPDSSPSFVDDSIVGRSDHFSLWENGYPGINFSESAKKPTPFMHSERDTSDTLNYTLITRITKSALLLFSDAVQLMPDHAACDIVQSPKRAPSAIPTLRHFTNILNQRIQHERNLRKLSQFSGIVSGLNDRHMTAQLNRAIDPQITAALASGAFMQKVFALMSISRSKKENFAIPLLNTYAQQDSMMKPLYLMALAHIGGENIDAFLADLCRNEQDPRILLEAMKSYAIRNKRGAISVFEARAFTERRPAVRKAIDELISTVTKDREIVQTW